MFQSTPPYKRATSFAILPRPRNEFQSTPPYKRATLQRITCKIEPMFQSTPPYKWATYKPAICRGVKLCFNPRPRTSGRLLDCPQELIDFLVSIHAPVQAGDSRKRRCHGFLNMFQSTPPYKRATHKDNRTPRNRQFQSTPPYKRATGLFVRCVRKQSVSIHAPVQAGDTSLRLY